MSRPWCTKCSFFRSEFPHDTDSGSQNCMCSRTPEGPSSLRWSPLEAPHRQQLERGTQELAQLKRKEMQKAQKRMPDHHTFTDRNTTVPTATQAVSGCLPDKTMAESKCKNKDGECKTFKLKIITKITQRGLFLSKQSMKYETFTAL